MTEVNEYIQNLEITIEEANAKIKTAEAVGRLMKNADFVSLVTEGYFITEASALVLCKAIPQNGDEVSQKNINKAIDAIGGFRFYLNNLVQEGNEAVQAKLDTEREITSIETGEG